MTAERCPGKIDMTEGLDEGERCIMHCGSESYLIDSIIRCELDRYHPGLCQASWPFGTLCWGGVAYREGEEPDWREAPGRFRGGTIQ
jgi:hypothetical protein